MIHATALCSAVPQLDPLAARSISKRIVPIVLSADSGEGCEDDIDKSEGKHCDSVRYGLGVIP